MQIVRVIASSVQAAFSVAVCVAKGELPDIYKTDEDCIKAYIGQPMPMQTRYVPFRIELHEPDEQGQMDGAYWRLDLPARATMQ